MNKLKLISILILTLYSTKLFAADPKKFQLLMMLIVKSQKLKKT